MKTNLYFFLVLVLSITFGNAQNNEENVLRESISVISFIIDKESKDVILNQKVLVKEFKETTLIDNNTLKQIIVRTNSDIRIYFNRKRKAGNIAILFPRINKSVKS